MLKNNLFIVFYFHILLSFSQNVYLTAFLDGDCTRESNHPRVIELYVNGSLNVSNFKIQIKEPNSNFWNYLNSIGSRTYSNEFIYIVSDLNIFKQEFPHIPDTNIRVEDVAKLADGNSKIRLVDTSKANKVIDIFGTDDTNANGSGWNYSNSFIQRKDGNVASPNFSQFLWVKHSSNFLLNKGLCNGTNKLSTYINLGSYAPLNLSTKEHKKNENAQIFPNPAKDFINIKIKNTTILEIEIFSTSGSVIKKIIPSQKNDKIKVAHLQSGIYFVKVKSLNSTFIRKLIIQKK